jgi:ATP-dependent DNA helicase PIF1
LNACGGSGKTYTLSINLLLAAVRAQGSIALGAVLSGIAATLLDNGRTLHSRCKVPIKIQENSMCSIFKREALAELFRQAKLLIIDEVTMGHRHVLEAVAEPYKISEIVMLCLGD